MSRLDLLLFAAHPPDLRGFRTSLGDSLHGTIGSLHVTAKTVGVGMGVAGASATKRVRDLTPNAVLFVGTAGVYPGLADYAPHDVAVASKHHLMDLAVLSGFAAFPDPMLTEIAPNPALAFGLAMHAPRNRQVPVASPLAATRDDRLAATVPAQTGCQLESLEAFAVAHACQLAQVPFAAVLGVSHVCGSAAAADYRRFERDASIAAADVVVRWIRAGAPGLPHAVQ